MKSKEFKEIKYCKTSKIEVFENPYIDFSENEE
jgi:hypothetical protein